MTSINLYAAWVGIFLGCIAGAVIGLFFHDEKWLGGYNSWPRRMLRLAHISFFGIAIINFFFAITLHVLQIEDGLLLTSRLLIVGAVAMPLVCYLSAIKNFFRHLFFIPAASVIIALTLLLWRLFIK